MGSFRESLDLFIADKIEDSLLALRQFDQAHANICKTPAETHGVQKQL